MSIVDMNGNAVSAVKLDYTELKEEVSKQVIERQEFETALNKRTGEILKGIIAEHCPDLGKSHLWQPKNNDEFIKNDYKRLRNVGVLCHYLVDPNDGQTVTSAMAVVQCQVVGSDKKILHGGISQIPLEEFLKVLEMSEDQTFTTPETFQ
jgi:hypothetical protein